LGEILASVWTALSQIRLVALMIRRQAHALRVVRAAQCDRPASHLDLVAGGDLGDGKLLVGFDLEQNQHPAVVPGDDLGGLASAIVQRD